jgi:hypothetical protein
MHALDDSADNFIKVIFTQMQNTQAFFARELFTLMQLMQA